jgi:sec-independent protein translocase protein TatB|tara:strand:+ start:2120 stop:2341 length:222 start_codon:yes stop_codon:yes gene_type:complete
MPQIGWFELLVVVTVAILVIGPKDFPVVLNKIGSFVGTLKRYFSDVQRNVSQITDVDLGKQEKSKKKIKKDNE